MKKIISITLLFVLATITLKAQNTAKSVKVLDKDIYVLMMSSESYKDVGAVRLTNEQISKNSDLESRIKMFINNAPKVDYDAVFTRDGVTVRLLKYDAKEVSNVGSLPKSFAKDAYFLTIPTKEFEVVRTKELSQEEIHLAFHNIVNKCIKNATDLTYDAVLIKNKTVEYITYK